jgi:thioredoxin reductase
VSRAVAPPAPEFTQRFDVVVIGGGAAGLTGALTLARARRSVLVLDAGEPRNAPASGVHGYLGLDGIPPRELVRRGVEEVRRYGGQVRTNLATTARRDPNGFVVTTDDGATVRARRLLVTTGVLDELPELPGLRALWGSDVIVCPYCHGFEIADQPLGVLGIGPWAVHQALIFRQWTDDVVLFLHQAPELSRDDLTKLAARDIEIVLDPVVGLETTDGRLSGIQLASGCVVARRALALMPRATPRSGPLTDLGIATSEHPLGLGLHIPADPTGATSVPGVRVAGNLTEPGGWVSQTVAAGAQAAAALNMELIDEDTHHAVQHRATLDAP